jgi:threonyl-tRNA synthetase
VLFFLLVLGFFLLGQQVFWHSSAHILGEAMERVYGGCLCYGPPIENGFYYDMFIDDKQVRQLCYHEPVDLRSELNMFASIIRFCVYSTDML